MPHPSVAPLCVCVCVLYCCRVEFSLYPRPSPLLPVKWVSIDFAARRVTIIVACPSPPLHCPNPFPSLNWAPVKGHTQSAMHTKQVAPIGAALPYPPWPSLPPLFSHINFNLWQWKWQKMKRNKMPANSTAAHTADTHTTCSMPQVHTHTQGHSVPFLLPPFL